MVPVNFQPGQGYNSPDCTLGLNNPQSSQFLASPKANIPFEASEARNGISISGKLKVVLHNHSLWLKFYRQQTEMILNKLGRRMFPFPVYKIHGMNPVAHYQVFLEIVPVDEYHWRFQDGRWSQCEKTENNIPGNQLYIHPDSPNTGAHWMKKEIKFEKLKMTNNKEATNNENKMILLQSFHKYQPRLGIEEVRDGEHEAITPSSFTHSFTFPETEFIAVTAYQNAKLSQLKIEYNPFARGFRESYHGEESVNKCLSTTNSTAVTTTSPETGSIGSLLELGEGSCQANERAPLSPWLLTQASQPLQGYTYDSTPSSSNLLSLGMSGMDHGFLPFTSPPTTHNLREYAVVPQGHWCLSSSTNFTKNSGGWLQAVPSVSMDTVTRAEEEKQLEGEPRTYALTSHSNDSGLGEEVSKKRALSPDDSRDEICPGWKHRQQARRLTSLEFCATMISTENASSGFTVGPGEGTCQVMDETSMTPGFLPQLSKEPMGYACDSIHSSNNLQPLGMNGMNPGLSLSICSPTMPFGRRQDVMDPAGDYPTFSSADSNMSNGNWLQSVPPVPMDPLMETQKEVDPDEELLTYASTLQSLDSGWFEENSERGSIS